MSNLQTQSDRPTFGAWVADDVTKEILLPTVRDRGWEEASVRTGGVTAAVRTLSNSPCPMILIVDVSNSHDIRLDMQQLADVCEPDTLVVALGTENDVALYRDLLHAGVMDYLVKPLASEMFSNIIDTALEGLSNNETVAIPTDPEDQRKIMVIGLRGGLGASTIASNLAYSLSSRPQPTVLMDMDLSFGVAAMLFDLEPGRGLIDALDNPSRVDGLFLERAMVKPTTNLSILAAEAPIGSLNKPQEGALKNLIGILAESTAVQVIDMPRSALADHMDALENITDVVIITDMSLCGARDTIRMIGFLEKSAPHLRVQIVASRSTITGQEVGRPDFENSIERNLLATVPHDPKLILAAAKAGKPIVAVAAKAKISQVIHGVATALDPSADDSANANSGLIKRLFAKAS